LIPCRSAAALAAPCLACTIVGRVGSSTSSRISPAYTASAEYKHVVLGLIFLRYTSDAFEGKHADPRFPLII